MTADTIARLKITLDAVEPVILRRVEVPFDIRLDRLHLAIQAAMGWTNSHLYEIRAGHTGWGIPDRDSGEGPLDARKAHLDDVIEDVGTKTLKYLYDFGDDWEHTIKIERLLDPEPSIVYPRLLEASGRCPPEDIGGPWGYAEFLEAIHDPNTNATPNSTNGSEAPSIQPKSIPMRSLQSLPLSQNDGCESPRPSANTLTDPRCSSEGSGLPL